LSTPEVPAGIPDRPGAVGERVFREPWEAQAFALAVRLNEAGLFDWPHFAERLGEALAQAGEAGDGPGYYRCWLNALQRVVEERGLVGSGELARREADWHRAAANTPHGRPILLLAAGEPDRP
jgi:nitrile hydratase accessory protein